MATPNSHSCEHEHELSAEYHLAIADSITLPKTNARRRRVKRVDPTRTTTIQNQMERAINRQFAKLLTRLKLIIDARDAFGLKINRHIPTIDPTLSPGAFAFETDATKLNEFAAWLDGQVEDGILAVDSNGKHLTDDFITRANRVGASRAQTEIRKAGGNVSAINISLGRSVPAERVAVLHVRTFNELKGLTDTMKQQMRRALADGIAQGQGAKQVAREMTKIVKVTRDRALTIARTEIVRAHHTGNIAEMKRLGIQGVKVLAEWKTAGDNRVCASCAGLEGRVFTVKRIEGLIPLHPNCRCVALPLVEGGLPPGGRPKKGFATTKSDGTKRTGDPKLFEKSTGGAKKPGFEFKNQNPVTNSDEVATLLKAIRATAGDTVADLMALLTQTVGDTLKANHALLTGEDGIDGLRGARGYIGGTGDQGFKGETGYQGATGDKGDSVKGARGYTGATGETGGDGLKGLRGKNGHIGMRGKQGKTGTRGDKGAPGREGNIPDHELKLNEDGTPNSIRFQRPDDQWGDWLKLNEDDVPLPAVPTGVQDIEIRGRRIRFLLPNGDWTKWISFGGGGGGGGGAVETDSTIEGAGSTADPLRLYGIVNSCIDQNLTIQTDQVMVNKQITVKAGSTVSIESGGQLHLLKA